MKELVLIPIVSCQIVHIKPSISIVHCQLLYAKVFYESYAISDADAQQVIRLNTCCFCNVYVCFLCAQVGSPISKTNIIHPHVYVSILLLSDYNLHKNVMLHFQIILWYNFVLNSFLNVIFSKSPGIWFF